MLVLICFLYVSCNCCAGLCCFDLVAFILAANWEPCWGKKQGFDPKSFQM